MDGVAWDHKYQFDVAGGNFKPGLDIQGVIGSMQLRREEKYAKLRKRNHGIIRRELEPIQDLVRTAAQLPGSDPSWFGYPLIIGTRNRREIIKRIESRGVASRLLFGGNMARQRFIRGKSLNPVNLEKADEIMEKCFLVGTNHTITEEEAHYIGTVVREEITR